MRRSKGAILRIAGNETGLTLIELLVAMMVLTLIVMIVYSSFTSVTATMEMARNNAEMLRFRQFLRSNLGRHLATVYVDAGCEAADFQFVGVNEDGPYGPADSLRFCTSLPLSGATALPGVLRVVQYEGGGGENGEERASALEDVGGDGGEEEGSYLVITEEPLVLSELGFTEQVQAEEMEEAVIEHRVPVMSLDITYYDGEKSEWVEEWDSLDMLRLPWAVRVKANFPRTEEEWAGDRREGIDPMESPDLDMMVALPVGGGTVEQFIDYNHRRMSSEVDEEAEL